MSSNVFPILSVILLIAGSLCLFFWRREQDWWLPKIRFERLGSQLPFNNILEDDITLTCVDGTLVSVLAIKSLDYSILTHHLRK